jgi:hypothetical protein
MRFKMNLDTSARFGPSISHFAFRIPQFVKVIGLLLALVSSSGAAEWKSEELNCAITFPEGWKEVKLPETRMAVQNEDKTKTIFVIVQDVPPNLTVNEAFILGAKLAFTQRGGVIVSEQRPTIEQLPA